MYVTTREQAHAILEQTLSLGRSIVIDGSATIERSWGWVFFTQSRAYMETGDPSEMLAGNAPLIVERESGRIFETGTADPLDFYLTNFEATGDWPHWAFARDRSASRFRSIRLSWRKVPSPRRRRPSSSPIS